MDTDNILPWRASIKKRPPVLEPKVLWTVQKQRWQIDCMLQGRDPEGWCLKVLLNGQWFFSCRFTSWADAIQAADDKQAELLTGGWVIASFS